MMEDNKKNNLGEVKIADDVIAAIAGLAATDAEGVVCLAGGLTHDMITSSNVRNLRKSVRISIEDGKAAVRLALILTGNRSIPEVTSDVKEKVVSAIESMTGLPVTDVNITIAGVNV